MILPSTKRKVVPLKTEVSSYDALTEICREGAKKMLQAAIEQEVAEYIERHQHIVDEHGHQVVVRNGFMPERGFQTGIGSLTIKRPRVNDKRIDEDGQKIRFSSSILPPYLRRSKSIEDLLPWLYLRGISTGNFSEALTALLGHDAPGLSATTITRLKSHWSDEYKEWSKRSLKGKNYVYFWADGVYSKIRLGEDNKQCLLVIMGATLDGKKEIVSVIDGMRESELSWSHVLLDLKKRGLENGPKIAVGDGAMGFWAAISKIFPNTKWQRCWCHKTANVLNCLPKSQQPKAKSMLHEIWMAATKKEAEKAFDMFISVFRAKYPKATDCLEKDREALLAFYSFPAEHWKHIRTTNPIESTFATIRLRTKRTKGHGSAEAALAMAFKLAQCAEKKWRRLDKPELLAEVINIKVRFVDGVKRKAA